MRRLSLPRDTGEASAIDLTPLLDVVFIMLIFFIVTATFLRETGLVAVRSESSNNSDPDAESIVVVIDAGNGFRIDGLSIAPAALRSHLVERRSRLPDSPLIIQPDKASTTRALAAAIDAARLARITDVAIADAPGAAQF